MAKTKDSALAVHVYYNDQSNDLNNSRIISKESHLFKRKLKESRTEVIKGYY